MVRTWTPGASVGDVMVTFSNFGDASAMLEVIMVSCIAELAMF